MKTLSEYIAEQRAIEAKATVGPWELDFKAPFGAGGAVCSNHNIQSASWSSAPMEEIVKQPIMTRKNKDQVFDNGNFIVEARNNYVKLLSALDKMREQRNNWIEETYSNTYKYKIEKEDQEIMELLK